MLWMLTAAWAATPPPVSPEALEDTAAWEARARPLLDGPAGCVVFEGTLTHTVTFTRPGGWLGPGETSTDSQQRAFTGTLDKGSWTSLELPAPPPDAPLRIDSFNPIVGSTTTNEDREEGELSIGLGSGGTQIGATAGNQAMGLLDTLLDEIDPAITMSYALWEPQTAAVVLRQLVPVEDMGTDETFEVRTTFPGGGTPTALDAWFPPRMKLREGPMVLTLLNGQLHLRGQETALGLVPVSESASLVLGLMGMTIGFEQEVVYSRVRPCS